MCSLHKEGGGLPVGQAHPHWAGQNHLTTEYHIGTESQTGTADVGLRPGRAVLAQAWSEAHHQRYWVSDAEEEERWAL